MDTIELNEYWVENNWIPLWDKVPHQLSRFELMYFFKTLGQLELLNKKFDIKKDYDRLISSDIDYIAWKLLKDKKQWQWNMNDNLLCLLISLRLTEEERLMLGTYIQYYCYSHNIYNLTVSEFFFIFPNWLPTKEGFEELYKAQKLDGKDLLKNKELTKSFYKYENTECNKSNP